MYSEEVTSAQSDEARRAWALEAAIQSSRESFPEQGAALVKRAKLFEDYLKGGSDS